MKKTNKRYPQSLEIHSASIWSVLLGMSLAVLGSTSVFAKDGGITFEDVAAGDGAGIDYRRIKSPRDAVMDAFRAGGIFKFQESGPLLPYKPRGLPGVVIFDFDRDGDLDFYVTNGPGAANSLYANQWVETGALEFVDVAEQAGAALTQWDNTGACFGDIDNDGDHDLYVLSLLTDNRLLENLGDGTFRDITDSSGAGGGVRNPSSCSMGDVNGDGLLDIVVGNLYDNWEHRLPMVLPEYLFLLEHNQLFVNQGQKVFAEQAEAAGIQNFAGPSCAIALVDYDQDGDVDLVVADDQGTKPWASVGGVDNGFLRLYRNDGTGQFTDVTRESGTERIGVWMGLSFGDFNRDGYMDIFATNAGDYVLSLLEPLVGIELDPGEFPSAWFLANGDGTFDFPGTGDLGYVPFGWGTSAPDYDNDGDTDIIFHGGMSLGAFVESSNPGAILQNNGHADFDRDALALAGSTNHTRRNVQGMAVGDLNDDGFIDIISASNHDWPQPRPLVPQPPVDQLPGDAFDDGAFIWPTFVPVNPEDLSEGFVWSGIEAVDGTLSVEISSADNGNHWVKVSVLGTIGITPGGRVNRDGIGAVIRFQPDGNEAVLQPVLGGSSLSSQDSVIQTFGLGTAKKGTVDILWPGGVRNRLYDVKHAERFVFPEIPCSYEGDWEDVGEYVYCVQSALDELVQSGILSRGQGGRFLSSALRAFQEARQH